MLLIELTAEREASLIYFQVDWSVCPTLYEFECHYHIKDVRCLVALFDALLSSNYKITCFK